MIILSHLTHLEMRTLEQSLITKFTPELNTLEKDVSFLYTTWNPVTLNQSYNLKNPNASKVEVRLDNNNKILTTYSSINKAAAGLGVSRELISRYINKPLSFKSTLLELDVFVKTPNSLVDNTPVLHPKAKKYPPINYDVNSLNLDYIYLLSSDKSKIVDIFDNVNSAAKALEPSKSVNNKTGLLDSKYISRYLNQDRLVKTELGDFYFMCNPKTLIKNQFKTKSKLPWVINLTTGLALRFDTASMALKYFGFKDNHAFFRHLDKDTIYLKNYQFISNEKFMKLYPNVSGTRHQLDKNTLPIKTLKDV